MGAGGAGQPCLGPAAAATPAPRCARRVELDEDLPAHGQHFCTSCSRYFQSEEALRDHEKTKPHKRRIKALMGARPHNQADADWAAGMGAPDNGQAQRQAMDL